MVLTFFISINETSVVIWVDDYAERVLFYFQT